MGTTNKVYEQLKQLEITASNKNFKVDFSDTGTFGHSSKRQYAKLTTNSDKLKFLDRQLELNDTFLQGPLTYGGESKINLEERHELLLEKTRILDEVTQEKMALDLASYTEAMQNNKLAYGSPKNNKNEIFGSKEIVSDAGVNDQYYNGEVPKMSLVPEIKPVTTDEYIDPHQYNRDNKGQIITDTLPHNQLHSDKTPIYEDWSLGTNAIEEIVADEALANDTKELAIEAKKLADAKVLEEQVLANEQMTAEHYLKQGSGSYLAGDQGVQFPNLEFKELASENYTNIKEGSKLFSEGGDLSYYYETDNGESVLIENEADEIEHQVDGVNLTLQQITDNINQEAVEVEGIGTSITAMSEQGIAEAAELGAAEIAAGAAYVESAHDKALRILKEKNEQYEKSVGSGRGTINEQPGERAAHIAAEQWKKMTAEDKALLNDQYLGISGQASVNAGQDQDFIDAKNKALIEQKKALQTATQKSDEKLIETAKRVEEEKAERFAAAQAEAKANAEKLNAELEQDRLAAASALQREKDIKQRTSALQREKDVKERIADIKSQENLKKNAKTTPLGQSVQVGENQKKASLAKQLREKEIETYQNKLLKDQNQEAADTIGSKMDRDAYFLSQSKDPFAFSTLSYPRNLTNSPQIGHYLLFYVNVQNKTGYEYEGVTPTDGDYSVGDIFEKQIYVTDTAYGEASGATGDDASIGDTTRPEDKKYKTTYHYDKGADKGDINYQKRQVQRGGTGNTLRWNQTVLSKGRKVLTGMKSVHKTTTRITDSVALYMPSASNNTSVQYQDFETGMAGFLALGGKGVLDKILNNDYEGAASKFIGMGGTMLVEMLKKVGVEAVSAFTGANGVQQAFDKAFGQTLNPYLEVAFQSMGVRSFSYTFNFTPQNEKESKDVKAIIELFRFHMLPELKGAQHRYLTLPSTFDIHYMYQANPAVAKENDFMSKIATCVLTKCDVDYTPDGVRSFDSGAPAAQTMTLEFMETEMLTKEKVQQGF